MNADIAASVHQRLLNHSRSEGRRFNEVLQRYALERWLYRLSVSSHADRLILKGGLLLSMWDLPVQRPTKDIDLLASTTNDLDAVRDMIREICMVEVEPDGLVFHKSTVSSERIAEDAVYEGVRSTFSGSLGNARLAMQIDLGFSDVVTPGPISMTFPTILELPAPVLRAYNRETTLAEKFEAMIKLGELNSRMKDFFDIWSLATSQTFDGDMLSEAIALTFRRRGTVMDANAVCFEDTFGNSETKQTQWRGFLKRTQLAESAPALFVDVWRGVMTFLRPMISPSSGASHWTPGGPWSSA
jgi:predicted nucleotidyltransferase component of viral defense system